MDTIKGVALIGTFIGVLITFAMWVWLWENVWQASVEPTRAQIYKVRIGPSDCLALLAWWWKRQAGSDLGRVLINRQPNANLDAATLTT